MLLCEGVSLPMRPLKLTLPVASAKVAGVAPVLMTCPPTPLVGTSDTAKLYDWAWRLLKCWTAPKRSSEPPINCNCWFGIIVWSEPESFRPPCRRVTVPVKVLLEELSVRMPGPDLVKPPLVPTIEGASNMSPAAWTMTSRLEGVVSSAEPFVTPELPDSARMPPLSIVRAMPPIISSEPPLLSCSELIERGLAALKSEV